MPIATTVNSHRATHGRLLLWKCRSKAQTLTRSKHMMCTACSWLAWTPRWNHATNLLDRKRMDVNQPSERSAWPHVCPWQHGGGHVQCASAVAAASWDEMMAFERSAGAGRRARPGGRRATRGCELGRAHMAASEQTRQRTNLHRVGRAPRACRMPRVEISCVHMHTNGVALGV